MPVPPTLKLAIVAAWLAMASSAALSDGVTYWSWSPGCDAQNMGTTTACWSTAPFASSRSPQPGTASPPGATDWVYVVHDTAALRALTFSGGQRVFEHLSLWSMATPVQLLVSGGELTVNEDLFVGVTEQVTFIGAAELVQSAGAVRAQRLHIGTSNDVASRYTLSGGNLTADLTKIGFSTRNGVTESASKGILEIRGPSANASLGTVNVSSKGALDLTAGQLTAQQLNLAVGAALSFRGGTVEIQGQGSHWQGGVYGYGSAFGSPATLRLAPGATLSVEGLLGVGAGAAGDLAVGAGAQLGTRGVVMGSLGSNLFGFFEIPAPGMGRAVVSGASARWSNIGDLDIGTQGSGDLKVLAGGQVTSTDSFMGRVDVPKPLYGRNSALVRGTGSVWRSDGGLTIGGGAAAPGQESEAAVDEGGRIEVGGLLRVWGGSSLQVAGGGSASAGALAIAAGGVVTLRDGALGTTSGARVEGTLRLAPTAVGVVDGAVVLGETGRLEVATGQVVFRGPLTAETAAQIHNDGEMVLENRAMLQVGVALTGGGAKYVHGTLALGDDSALFADTNALALMPGSVLEVDISGASDHDRYTTASWLLLGGTLKLSSGHGYRGQAGDRFAILGGLLEGAFDSVNTSGFSLAPGLRWDFSQLNSAGIVGIAAGVAAPVPEPGSWALLLAGLAGVGGVARRRRG